MLRAWEVIQLMNSNPLSLAICGYGAAGRAREGACTALPDIHLAGIISNRSELATLNWQTALTDPKLNAIAISTENTRHATLVEQALKAGKHVLCDYPLCFTKQQGQHLFQLAAQQQRVLHVEHIGLLSSAHREAKHELSTLGTLKRGTYEFHGNWNEKLAQPHYLGPAQFLAISRLLQLADWFGPFELSDSELQVDDQQLTLEMTLNFSQGGQIQFSEHREVGLKRHRRFVAELSRGPFEWKSFPKREALFQQDLQHFVQRIHSDKTCYYDEALMIQIIRQLEEV